MSPVNIDSEREEGEIIDDLDELSDISSEEEYLLRQRLQVLESYNNVLERKQAKRSSIGTSEPQNVTFDRLNIASHEKFWYDVSKISADELDGNSASKQNKDPKRPKRFLDHVKKKKPQQEHENDHAPKHKDQKKKHYKIKTKKKLDPKPMSDSSDETDYEYRNKRRKLADAVNVHGSKKDSSLTDRIKQMLNKPKLEKQAVIIIDDVSDKEIKDSLDNPRIDNEINKIVQNIVDIPIPDDESKQLNDLCNNVVSRVLDSTTESLVNSAEQGKNKSDAMDAKCDDSSDEDLELLRQNALQTKSSKTQPAQTILNIASEDEDSDTGELRLICLRSALLKRAIEMKIKQKLRKRLSSTVDDSLYSELNNQISEKCLSGNNTDIESVDMDIGISDGPDEDKRKDATNGECLNARSINNIDANIIDEGSKPIGIPSQDEIEEDEDLLRAKLLTSLNKSLPKLTNKNDSMKHLITAEPEKDQAQTSNNMKNTVPEEKRFIINIGDSDSGSDHEATKNLTKMHIKLSEQKDFQQKLDVFLKSTRLEVEKTKLPDLIQKQEVVTTEKFVPKAVKHLPKSEQIEYNKLVKRMAELERIKKARLSAMKVNSLSKDTLKPQNAAVDNSIKNISIENLLEQIALSRKTIADESAKLLKLKEESQLLIQKRSMIIHQLKIIKTAESKNKRDKRATETALSTARAKHQVLLRRSTLVMNSKRDVNFTNISNNKVASKLQKENEPLKDVKNIQVLKSVKVNIINDLHVEKPRNEGFSVSVDVSSNKRLIRLPVENSAVTLETVKEKKETIPDSMIEGSPNEVEDNLNIVTELTNDQCKTIVHTVVQTGNDGKNAQSARLHSSLSSQDNARNEKDYQSPLQAITCGSWNEDPNAVLCRFEVGGSCKDPDCKYLHPKLAPKH